MQAIGTRELETFLGRTDQARSDAAVALVRALLDRPRALCNTRHRRPSNGRRGALRIRQIFRRHAGTPAIGSFMRSLLVLVLQRSH